MERTATLDKIKEIKNISIIGYGEQKRLFEALDVEVENNIYPEIPFTIEELNSLEDDYILLLAYSGKECSAPLNIKRFIRTFGYKSGKGTPHFYNQDWYINEQFTDTELSHGWYLVKKDIIPSTVAVNPTDILAAHKEIKFPLAILCVYTFFANFFYTKGELLWKDSFIWCADTDVNGDSIYVGKYDNSLNLNNDGFSIHRHLSITKNYAAISFR